jgi:hypothetical protein
MTTLKTLHFGAGSPLEEILFTSPRARVQIPLYTQSPMCLGTVVACRSCQREAILFYPGGRCGEVEPFPSWHRICGRFDEFDAAMTAFAGS